MHIGREIQKELKRQQRTVVWFAKELNCDRVNAYNIFTRSNIDIDLLSRISIILHRNFLQELSTELKV